MTIQDNFVVVMAGGVGTRLWPFSRVAFPKQFHDLISQKESLLQSTVRRFEGIIPTENIYIVTNHIYKTIIKEQLPDLKDEQILLEPTKRNTAPCIAYATYKIQQKNPQANIVVTPADQFIRNKNLFKKTVSLALEATQKQDILVTLGIKPTRPDTGYGYIQYFEEDKNVVKKVKTFAEKPDLENAKRFIESGDFLWNAGVFIWNIESIIKAFEKYMPSLAENFEEEKACFYTESEQETIKRVYSLCKNKSIDIGVLEQAENVYVIPSSFDWSDLGTWKSLYENSKKDENENVITGGKVLDFDTRNSIIKMPKDKLVVVEGLDNYIVAEYDGVLLICNKDSEQRVKEFVARAKEKGENFV